MVMTDHPVCARIWETFMRAATPPRSRGLLQAHDEFSWNRGTNQLERLYECPHTQWFTIQENSTCDCGDEPRAENKIDARDGGILLLASRKGLKWWRWAGYNRAWVRNGFPRFGSR